MTVIYDSVFAYSKEDYKQNILYKSIILKCHYWTENYNVALK